MVLRDSWWSIVADLTCMGGDVMNAKVKQALFNLKDVLDMFAEDSIMITVQRKDLELIVKEMFFESDEWSNQSALGYAITAAEAIDLDYADISHLVTVMQREFDEKTLDAAAEIYRKSDY